MHGSCQHYVINPVRALFLRSTGAHVKSTSEAVINCGKKKKKLYKNQPKQHVRICISLDKNNSWVINEWSSSIAKRNYKQRQLLSMYVTRNTFSYLYELVIRLVPLAWQTISLFRHSQWLGIVCCTPWFPFPDGVIRYPRESAVSPGGISFSPTEANKPFAENHCLLYHLLLGTPTSKTGASVTGRKCFPFNSLTEGRWSFTGQGQHYSLWTVSPLHRHRPGREHRTEQDGTHTSNNIFDLFPKRLHSYPAPLYCSHMPLHTTPKAFKLSLHELTCTYMPQRSRKWRWEWSWGIYVAFMLTVHFTLRIAYW